MNRSPYRAPRLSPALEAKLVAGEKVPAGNWDLVARPAPFFENHYELLLDGAVLRAKLSREALLRVAAHLREAFTADWMGRIR